MLLILILLLVLPCAPLFASEKPASSLSVEHLEYRFAEDAALFDGEVEFGTTDHRVALKLVALTARPDTESAVSLLYRHAISERFDIQAGIEVVNGTRNFVFGVQGQAPHHVDTEVLAIIDEHGDGFLSAKLEHDVSISESLVLWPRLEVIGALQDDADSGIGAGLSGVLVELRLRYESRSRFMPYIGLSWERSLGDTARVLEIAGENQSMTTALAGVSFTY